MFDVQSFGMAGCVCVCVCVCVYRRSLGEGCIQTKIPSLLTYTRMLPPYLLTSVTPPPPSLQAVLLVIGGMNLVSAKDNLEIREAQNPQNGFLLECKQ